MQSKPVGWPAAGPVETVPDALLVLPGSSWPPAVDDIPAGTAELGSWSVDRELVGSSLPGQVRSRSGYSIASGSATFAQPTLPLVPWGRGVQAIGPGGKARLMLTHPGAQMQVGAFVVQPITGANTDNTVTLELAEDSMNLRKPVTLPTLISRPGALGGDPAPTIEASWILDQAARRGGYCQTPNPVPSAVFVAQCVGSPEVDRGTTNTAANLTRTWAGNAGGTWLTQGSISGWPTTDLPSLFYVTADRTGSGGTVTLGGRLTLEFGASWVLATITGNTGSPILYPVGTAPVARVQVEVNGKTIRVRVDNGAWSTPVTLAGTLSMPAGPLVVVAATSGYIRGIQVHTEDQNIWTPVTAKIEPTGSLLDAVIVPDAKDAWGIIQGIAAATQGAAWVDEAGVFTYRAYAALRGVGAVVETIEALDDIESLAWRVDPADVADRVTLTYNPADIQRVSGGSLMVWEATEAVQVGAGRTVTLYADLDAAVSGLAEWLPIWDATVPASRMSRWAAAISRDGGGAQPVDTALQVSAEMVSPSRARIRITNTTAATLWTVDGNGNPTLTLRANIVARMGEPRTITSGAPEADALAPLDVDLGVWVQDDAAAQRYLAWLTGQTAKAQATIERVRVAPDLGRQLGDLIRLTDQSSGLSTKAIITGIHLAGDPGSYTQSLDLALLDFVWVDFDTALATLGLLTWQDLDDYLAANHIDTFEDFDEWLITLGGTL